MKTISKQTIVISIFLLLVGVSVSSATTNVVRQRVVINDNQPPDPPDIDGPTNCKVGIKYYYILNSSGSGYHNDFIYEILWGVGPYIEEIISSPSSGEAVVSHIWNKTGIYGIRARARDIYGHTSGWSNLKVRVLQNPAFNNLLRFFVMFPLLKEVIIRLIR